MKVSIIIPIYNVAPYIKNCLLSVFNQTYKELEIILIDDCGTDRSIDIAKETISLYGKDFSIKLIQHPYNKGLSAARNTGVKEATGEYIFFLDSDDELTPNCIELLISFFIKYPHIDFVVGKIKTIGHPHEIKLMSNEHLKGEEVLSDYLQYKWNLAGCNKLIRTKFITEHKIRFLEGRLHEDNDSSFQMAIHAQEIACCNTPTYLYYYRPNSITSYKKLKNFEDLLYIICKNIEQLQKIKKTSSLQLYIADYIIHEIFEFTLSLIKEKNPAISCTKKKELVSKIISVKERITPFNLYITSNRLKNTILRIPNFTAIFIILKIYSKLRRL